VIERASETCAAGSRRTLTTPECTSAETMLICPAAPAIDEAITAVVSPSLIRKAAGNSSCTTPSRGRRPERRSVTLTVVSEPEDRICGVTVAARRGGGTTGRSGTNWLCSTRRSGCERSEGNSVSTTRGCNKPLYVVVCCSAL